MHLEHEMLMNPALPGLFCVSTSFRNEPNPVPGRHDLIFPMFEFEMKGTMDDLYKMECELLVHLGFNATKPNDEFPSFDYDELATTYSTEELSHTDELQMEKDHGRVVFLKNFPVKTSPFWNMKLNESGSHANKIDVILHGIETIGSAERSINKEEMRKQFYTISDGHYSKTLFSQFNKNRVEKELEEFLSFNFFNRCGGGIGMTRLIRAMKLSNLV